MPFARLRKDVMKCFRVAASMDAAVLSQQPFAVLRHRHDQSEAGDGFARDIAGLGGVLQIVSRGHEVRQVATTSAWSRGSRATHSTKSSTRGSAVSAIAPLLL